MKIAHFTRGSRDSHGHTEYIVLIDDDGMERKTIEDDHGMDGYTLDSLAQYERDIEGDFQALPDDRPLFTS